MPKNYIFMICTHGNGKGSQSEWINQSVVFIPVHFSPKTEKALYNLYMVWSVLSILREDPVNAIWLTHTLVTDWWSQGLITCHALFRNQHMSSIPLKLLYVYCWGKIKSSKNSEIESLNCTKPYTHRVKIPWSLKTCLRDIFHLMILELI